MNRRQFITAALVVPLLMPPAPAVPIITDICVNTNIPYAMWLLLDEGPNRPFRQTGSFRTVYPDGTSSWSGFRFDRDIVGELRSKWPQAKIHNPLTDNVVRLYGFGKVA